MDLQLKVMFGSICAVVLLTAGSARAENDDTLDAPNVESFDNQFGPTSDVRSIYADIPQFGGPTSVGGQIAEDADVVPQWRLQGLQDQFEPWYRFKERLNERHGLQFNIDESIFYQVATDSLGENDAASGLVRVYGQWELLGRGSENPGMLVFKGENRHRIGTVITPFDLGFEAGSILPTGTFFSEFDFGVTNLYWKQYFFDRQLTVAIGRIDVTDFVDVYAMMNPLTHFINLAAAG
jgi:porin